MIPFNLDNREAKIGALLGSIAISPVALYFAAIFGTFGGAWGEYFLGGAGVLVGLLTAMIVVGASIVSFGGLIGAAIGYWLGRLRH